MPSVAQSVVIPFARDVPANMLATPSPEKARRREPWDDQAPAKAPATAELDLSALWPRSHRSNTDAPGFRYATVPSLQAAVPLGSEHDWHCESVTTVTDSSLAWHYCLGTRIWA